MSYTAVYTVEYHYCFVTPCRLTFVVFSMSHHYTTPYISHIYIYMEYNINDTSYYYGYYTSDKD